LFVLRKCVVFFVLSAVLFFGCRGRGGDSAGVPVETGITFAVFGNTGLSPDGGALASLAEALNREDVDFAVDLGNRLPPGASSTGIDTLWDAADDCAELFDVPVYPVAGKCDVFDYDSDVSYGRRYGPSWYGFTRNGVRFVVLNTEDETYREGFGVRARIGGEQLDWLERFMEASDDTPAVVFMHRPLWKEDRLLWSTMLRPVLAKGNIALVVTCYDGGLFDWGRIDGFRAVSTGCTGATGEAGPGLFPHILLVSVENGGVAFSVLRPDGTVTEGIPVTRESAGEIEGISRSLVLPPLRTDPGWKVSESLALDVVNVFDEPIAGEVRFARYGDTSWRFEPAVVRMNVEPGVKKTYRVDVTAGPPKLGPQPEYTVRWTLGGRVMWEMSAPVTVRIPPPRTGEPVRADAEIAAAVPYDFGGGTLKIPVDVEGYDQCGRCVIYTRGKDGIPECVYISPLRNFRPGINEFRWNGRDLGGNRVAPDTLVYRVFVYNKKAPPTWVAVGPPGLYGTVRVDETLVGPVVTTHDTGALVTYRIGVSGREPETDQRISFADFLDGCGMTGFARGERGRLYIGTDAGIVCVRMRKSGPVLDESFAENGYLPFTGYRGRKPGVPAYARGMLYVGMGGGNGRPVEVLMFDADTGEELGVSDLGGFYGGDGAPPVVEAADVGIFCAHPGYGAVVRMTRYGDVEWVSDPGSAIISVDADGRSFIYGIGVDGDGFSFVNTPGYSARCVVIGADGRGLFRVILVSLPGLRVSSVVPDIRGGVADGLYFVTRGGDRPYVFHVPFTVRKGLIVGEGSAGGNEPDGRDASYFLPSVRRVIILSFRWCSDER